MVNVFLHRCCSAQVNSSRKSGRGAVMRSFVKRSIDDGNAILDPPAEISEEESNIKYDEFKAVVNNNKCLTWEFTELSNSVNFLDLTLTIMPDGHTKTKLFEKPMALHLYIPPHSMHPPGILTSHMFGSILRKFRLNSIR